MRDKRLEALLLKREEAKRKLQPSLSVEKGLMERFIDPLFPKAILFPNEILCSQTGNDKSKGRQHLIIIVKMIIMKKANAVVKTEVPQHKAHYLGIQNDFMSVS